MSNLTTDKAVLRKEVLARRKAAHAAAIGAAEALRDHVLAGRYLTGAAIIAGYRPIRTEIDPTPLMEALHHAGHRLVVPVIIGTGLPLSFREWWPGVAMAEGAFGAAVPVDTQELTPDLVLVPLVAFDPDGWRLGYGGGFYDRSLERLRAHKKTLAIGLAYYAQRVATVPREPTDQPLDAIATERGLMPIGRRARAL